jgi:2-oxoglutarate ferredoxin oxidoreductase subunit gamma
MKRVVLIAGFGGQGILLIGQLLAEAAMRDGYHTTWFPSYGPEMRGGTANCTTIFSDAEIGSPIEATYDAVIAMNQPSLERFGPLVRPGGVLLVNESMVPVRLGRPDITELRLAATEVARAAGIERAANVVMLGAFVGVDGTISEAGLDAAIEAIVGKKHPELIEVNRAALRAGQEAGARAARTREGSVTHVVMHG